MAAPVPTTPGSGGSASLLAVMVRLIPLNLHGIQESLFEFEGFPDARRLVPGGLEIFSTGLFAGGRPLPALFP